MVIVTFRVVDPPKAGSGLQNPTYIPSCSPPAADLAAAIVNDLQPDVQRIVEAHFFDGESIFKIQRRYKLKRRDLEAMIKAALVTMRMALRSRGVRAVGDAQ